MKFAFVPSQGVCWLTDHSTNGMFVNKEMVKATKRRIEPGETISFTFDPSAAPELPQYMMLFQANPVAVTVAASPPHEATVDGQGDAAAEPQAEGGSSSSADGGGHSAVETSRHVTSDGGGGPRCDSGDLLCYTTGCYSILHYTVILYYTILYYTIQY